jgi:hypothetical protein
MDYSGGMSQYALRRRPGIHTSVNAITASIRESSMPGTVWWTDISHKYEQDFDGNHYGRTFAEEHTSYSLEYFSVDKSCASLINHLEKLKSWVIQHVPGAKLRVLRCDFGSEYARQGRGDDVLTKSLSSFCDANPGIRVHPVAPRAQAYNKAELTIQKVSGHAQMNAVRARLGGSAWSFLKRGANFQHNHHVARSADDPDLRNGTRSYLLTGITLDASTMLGYVGQLGWIQTVDGKASSLRDTAEPVLYLHPSLSCSGQLVLVLRDLKIHVVRAVSLCLDPLACSALMAGCAYHDPRGSLTRPLGEDYAAQLRALVTPVADPWLCIVSHDPLGGLPMLATALVPQLGPSGDLEMVPASTDLPHHPWEAPSPLPAWLDLPQDWPGDTGPGRLPTPPAAPAPPPPLCPGAPVGAFRLAGSAASFLQSAPATTRLWFRPGAKAPGSASGQRYVIYSHATSLAHFNTLHPDPARRRDDLRWDLAHGHALILPDLALSILGHPATPDVSTPMVLDSDEGPWALLAVGPPTSWAAASGRATAFLAHTADEAGLAYLESLEERPPATSVGSQQSQGIEDLAQEVRPWVFGAAYSRASAAAQASLDADMSELPLDHVAWDYHDFAFQPGAVLLAASPPPQPASNGTLPSAPISVAAARERPDYHEPGGWHEAILKEIRRVESFAAWELCPISAFFADLRDKGPDLCSMAYIVTAQTIKTTASGDLRAVGVANKFRVTLADKCELPVDSIQTYSCCVDDTTNRLMALISPLLGAEQTTIDISGAYFHGAPLPARSLYAVVPKWLHHYGPYPATDAHGRRNVLKIVGNMPGRRDAGRIWQVRLDAFLVSYGMRQLVTDLRVWVYESPLGRLIVHDHVDDSRLTYTTIRARDHFYLHWAGEFGEPLISHGLNEDFTGLRHRFTESGGVEISCQGVITSLASLIAPYPMRAGTPHDTPISTTMLRRLLAQDPGIGLRVDLVPIAQKLVGTIGFVVNNARPEAHFAFSVASRFARPTALTDLSFSAIVRLAHYLVSSRDLVLTITPPADGHNLFLGYTDASHGNAGNGASYAGAVVMSAGGGAISWKCIASSSGDDAPGSMELRMVVVAYKYILGLRTLLKDMHCGLQQTAPTPLFTDSRSVEVGAICERVNKGSRWMATRYAMIRWAILCLTIVLLGIASEDNPADILTKALPAALFFQHRAVLLGLVKPPLGRSS